MYFVFFLSFLLCLSRFVSLSVSVYFFLVASFDRPLPVIVHSVQWQINFVRSLVLTEGMVRTNTRHGHVFQPEDGGWGVMKATTTVVIRENLNLNVHRYT